MVSQIWVNIGSGNGVFPDGTKAIEAITWINVDLSLVRFCGTPLRAISQEVLLNLICDICSEIVHLKLQLYFPGANEWEWLSLTCLTAFLRHQGL